MKALFYRIPRKVRLVLSVVLLFISVYLLWSLLSFGMPTQNLAVRKAEAELGLPRGEWTTTALVPNYTYSNNGVLRFSRREDDFYVAQSLYNSHFNFLWEASISQVPPLSPWRLIAIPAPDSRMHSETWCYLIADPDPATARVELIFGGQTVVCAETDLDSGFWVCSLQVPTTDEDLPASIRTYSTAGALIYATPLE